MVSWKETDKKTANAIIVTRNNPVGRTLGLMLIILPFTSEVVNGHSLVSAAFILSVVLPFLVNVRA